MSAPGRDPVTLPGKPLRILACVLCQRRKVKCDRKDPCSNCVKANTLCTPSSPAPTRRRRRPNVELQARLARCEELLEEFASVKVEEQQLVTNVNTLRPSQIPAGDHPHLDWKPAGKLVVEDGGVRFTDNFLWATVYEELRAMREIMEANGANIERPGWRPSEAPDHSEEDLLLRGDSSAGSVEELQLTPSQIFRLWQVYLDRVNPVTKIIHVPTLQPFLVNATSGSQSLAKNIEALLLSIYTMAVVSMTEEECLDILGIPRKEAFRRFSAGVRLSLIRVGFLKSHDLTTLQALVLHLLSLQGRYDSHAAWIMNGVCIRIAQKMGLHRDGELLGLSPFETEMRRRVWWQIVMLDVKYAMMSGLTHSLLPRSCDCKMPKNLNDADVHPSAKESFQDRDGPTEMIVCLVVYKVGEFILQRNGLDKIMLRSAMGVVSSGPPTEDQSAELNELTKDLEDSLNNVIERFSDPSAGSVHELAVQVKLSFTTRMREMVRPPYKQPEWGTEITTPKDNIFKLTVSATEHAIRQYLAIKNSAFLWFMQSNFQYNVFIYMVGQLRHRTSGTLVERAWNQIPAVYNYHGELFDLSQESNMTLAKFILKAWGLRREVLYTRYGFSPDLPDYIMKLQTLMPLEYGSVAAVANIALQSSIPAMESQEYDMETSWDQLFPGQFDTATLSWDMLPMPQESVEEQLSALGGFEIGSATEWGKGSWG